MRLSPVRPGYFLRFSSFSSSSLSLCLSLLTRRKQIFISLSSYLETPRLPWIWCIFLGYFFCDITSALEGSFLFLWKISPRPRVVSHPNFLLFSLDFNCLPILISGTLQLLCVVVKLKVSGRDVECCLLFYANRVLVLMLCCAFINSLLRFSWLMPFFPCSLPFSLTYNQLARHLRSISNHHNQSREEDSQTASTHTLSLCRREF